MLVYEYVTEDTYLGNKADPLSLNLYVYCRNNPLVYVDYSGHLPSQAEYNAYAEYYGISQSGAWKDTVDQVLINDSKGSVIGSTSDPSDWACAGYAGNGSVSNVSDTTYNALVDQWGLSTNNSPYKDVIDTLLGIGGFDSFTNVPVYNGVFTLDYNQITGVASYALNPVALIGASLIAGPHSSLNLAMINTLDWGKGGGWEVTSKNAERNIYYQLALMALGYTNASGIALKADGNFGTGSQEALDKFKKDWMLGSEIRTLEEVIAEVLQSALMINLTISYGSKYSMPDFTSSPNEYREWVKGLAAIFDRPSVVYPTTNFNASKIYDPYLCICDRHARGPLDELGNPTSTHYGIDLLPKKFRIDGDPVKSAINGIAVVHKENGNSDGGYGNSIHVYSFDGSVYTRYSHLSAIGITDGQIVAAGDVIGAMGGTGGGGITTYGTHLHFEWRVFNQSEGEYKHTDPLNFLPK